MRPAAPTRRTMWVPILLLLLLGACGGNGGGGGNTPTPPAPAPPPAPSPPPGVPQITGTERLLWDQPAPTLADAQGYRYTLYVNDAPTALPGHACEATGTAGVFTCGARLPGGLPLGLIALSLSAVLDRNGTSAVSGRTAPLQVFVVTAPAATSVGTDGTLRLDERDDTLDGAGGTAIVDLASVPDGRLLAVDAAGRVFAIEGDRVVPRPALDPASSGTPPVASLTVTPDFERSRAVLAIEAADDRGTAVWDVVRYRELGGTLGERTVIVPAIARRGGPHARVRIGPDGLAYLAFAQPAGAADPRAVSLVRFELDGRPPAGESTRITRSGWRGGVAFDWHPSTGALWTGTSDVAAGAFEIGDGRDARAAVVVALEDGTLQRHVVVAAVPSRILQRAALADAPAGRVTAVVRSRHGRLIVAVSEAGKAPAVRVLDPR